MSKHGLSINGGGVINLELRIEAELLIKLESLIKELLDSNWFNLLSEEQLLELNPLSFVALTKDTVTSRFFESDDNCLFFDFELDFNPVVVVDPFFEPLPLFELNPAAAFALNPLANDFALNPLAFETSVLTKFELMIVIPDSGLICNLVNSFPDV